MFNLFNMGKKNKAAAEKKITATENLDNLEKELKAEYGINDTKKQKEDVRADLMADIEQLAKEVEKATDIEKATTPDSLEEKIEELEKVEKKLEAKIEEAEKKIVEKSVPKKSVYDTWYSAY